MALDGCSPLPQGNGLGVGTPQFALLEVRLVQAPHHRTASLACLWLRSEEEENTAQELLAEDLVLVLYVPIP